MNAESAITLPWPSERSYNSQISCTKAFDHAFFPSLVSSCCPLRARGGGAWPWLVRTETLHIDADIVSNLKLKFMMGLLARINGLTCVLLVWAGEPLGVGDIE